MRLAICLSRLAPPSSQVDFDGPFPLEGGKQVANVATRYLARLVRKCPVAAKTPTLGKGGAACHGGPHAGKGEVEEGLSCGPGAEGVPVMRLTINGTALDAVLLL